MNKNQKAAELAKAFSVNSLPSKLRYRIRKYMKQFSSQPQPDIKKAALDLVKITLEELSKSQETQLAKSSSQFTVYDSGCVKMDFGPEVSDEMKKAAIVWAKNRGMTAIEASLAKSGDAPQYYIFAPSGVLEVGSPISIFDSSDSL